MKSFLKGILANFCICLFLLAVTSHAQDAKLDKSLAPSDDGTYSNVFQDMGVVQRRSMKKSGKFLVSNYGSLDFSDGPYSMYGFNLDLGYALSDFWEIYINTSPFFISNKRGFASDIEKLYLDPDKYPDGCTGGDICTAKVTFIKPKMQVGVEILWAPAYGKDSLGSRRVVHSDTFFKMGVSNIFFQGGKNGLKFHSAIGKTYFFYDWLGFRVAATANLLQTYRSAGASVEPVKSTSFFGIVEAGFIFYL